MAVKLVVLGLMLFQAAGEAAPAAAAQEAPAAQAAPAAEGTAGSDAKAAPADAPAGAAPAGGNGANAQEAPPWMSFAPILFIGVLFYFMLLRPQAREQKRRQELLGGLKKNDKVVTTGGMIGTIADMTQDGKFVTLKFEDSTRIRFLRSAIHGPLDDKAEPPAAT